MKIVTIPFLVFYLCLLSLPLKTYSQNYFSKRNDFNNNMGWDFANDIIQQQQGEYIIQSEAQVIWDSYHRRIGFLHLDSIGNPIGGYKIYQDSVYSIGGGYPGSFIHLQSSGGYALVGFKSVYVTGGRYDRGLLMRFDENLDTLWTK